ncbi:MAG TPA: LysE family translocator [Aquamicrobium sp.]|nr:LysE family translocator [Aquamicrobium sp.]
MSFELWAAFAVASAVVVAIPGPTVLLVISYALGHGRRPALALVAGVALGDFTAMTASILGVGALLAASATLFTALKWIGAAYLVYLGIRLWRAPIARQAEADVPVVAPRRIFLHAYAVTALNPKSIVFFVAFLPQFLDLAGNVVLQLAVFEATFLVLATLNAAAYALMASLARGAIRRPGVQKAVNRAGGSLMIGAGLLAAGWRRAAS